MLKISQVGASRHPVLLKLEGRLVGPWVEELERICEALLDEGDRVSLEMADVSFLDASGVASLTRLKTEGVSFGKCSPFVEEQLRSGTPKQVLYGAS